MRVAMRRDETWRATNDSLPLLAGQRAPLPPAKIILIFPRKCSRDDSLPIILKD